MNFISFEKKNSYAALIGGIKTIVDGYNPVAAAQQLLHDKRPNSTALDVEVAGAMQPLHDSLLELVVRHGKNPALPLFLDETLSALEAKEAAARPFRPLMFGNSFEFLEGLRTFSSSGSPRNHAEKAHTAVRHGLVAFVEAHKKDREIAKAFDPLIDVLANHSMREAAQTIQSVKMTANDFRFGLTGILVGDSSAEGKPLVADDGAFMKLFKRQWEFKLAHMAMQASVRLADKAIEHGALESAQRALWGAKPDFGARAFQDISAETACRHAAIEAKGGVGRRQATLDFANG